MSDSGKPGPPDGEKRHKIAVVFRRLGPYHIARLQEASKLFNLFVFEYAANDSTYAWDAVQGNYSFDRRMIAIQTPRSLYEKRRAKVSVHRMLDEIGPEACALPGWSMPEALIGLQWCLRRGVPAILMTESTAGDNRRVWWKEWLKKMIVRQFSGALAGGAPQTDYAIKLGMPRSAVFSGYDVVDNDYFEKQTAKVRACAFDCRQRYALPENYFLASARFIEKKNLLRLVQAYADYVARRKLDQASRSNIKLGEDGLWHLVLLGDGPLRKELTSVAAQLQLGKLVHMPGFKQYDDLPVYYALARCFIMPSISEQWGLVVNEAMASGLPVLVSNRCGCAADLVRDGVNGYALDPVSVENMSSKMSVMHFMSSEQRSAMGIASSRIIAEWGPSRFALGLKGAFEYARTNHFRSATATSHLFASPLIYWQHQGVE